MIESTLARFYGWSPHVIQSLTVREVTDYYRASNILQAKENLLKLNVMDYPNMDNKGRKKLFNGIKKVATSNDIKKEATTKDLADFFSRMTNGR